MAVSESVLARLVCPDAASSRVRYNEMDRRMGTVVLHFGWISAQSRKAKAVRNLYEFLRRVVKPEEWVPAIEWLTYRGVEGIRVPVSERYRVLNIRIHDEHLSPYFKTDMNLFHLLMIDDTVDVTLFRGEKGGWLFVFDGVPAGPKPFGGQGYDTR